MLLAALNSNLIKFWFVEQIWKSQQTSCVTSLGRSGMTASFKILTLLINLTQGREEGKKKRISLSLGYFGPVIFGRFSSTQTFCGNAIPKTTACPESRCFLFERGLCLCGACLDALCSQGVPSLHFLSLCR